MTAPEGETAHIIARTARSNPDINGRTLFLTSIGLWTLDADHARLFTEEEALRVKGDNTELRIEAATEVRSALLLAGEKNNG